MNNSTYAVEVTRKYFGGQSERSLLDECFATKSEARAWIASADEREYHLSQNESGRPSYRVLDRNKRAYKCLASR